MASTVFPAASSAGVVQKAQAFTSTGTFVAPSNCYSLSLFLVGGGGGGGAARITSNNHAVVGGGGGGASVVKRTVSITPGTTYTFTIGAGGAGGTYTAAGAVGSDSTMTGSGFTTITALGGGGGQTGNRGSSTYYAGTARATGGGAYGVQNQVSGGGGGAGGNGISYRGGTEAYNTNTGATAYPKPNTANGNNEGIQSSGGTGGLAAVFESVSPFAATSLAGIGIDNYGNGGPGAAIHLTINPAFFCTVSSFAGIASRKLQGCDSAAGVASIANTGNGGGGASVAQIDDCGGQENTGGAGGSGFAYITYWT